MIFRILFGLLALVIALVAAAAITHDPNLGQLALVVVLGGLTTIGIVVFIAVLWIVGAALLGGHSKKDRYHRFN